MRLTRRHLALTLPWAGAALAGPQAPLKLVAAIDAPYVLPPGHALGEGVDVDIARAALRLGGGLELRLERVPFRRALALLEWGEADLTLGLANTPERARYLAFSRPYGHESWYVFLRASAAATRVRGLNDLRALRVGLVRGFAYPAALQAALGTSPPTLATSREALLRMAAVGHVDVAVAERLTANWLLRELGLERALQIENFLLRGGGSPLMGLSRRSVPAMAALDAMNRGLARLETGGWSRFEAPYGVTSLPPDPAPKT